MASELPPRLSCIETEVRDIFKILTTGFQRIDRIKNEGRRGNQLEELTARMREAKRLIKEFDREMQGESKTNPESHKLLNETKQSMIKELNSFVSLRKRYTSSIGNRQELLDGSSHAGAAQDLDVRVASTLSNQELIQTGRQQMDETDKTIERSRKVVEETIHIGTETTTTLKGQTEQVGRITNELDTIQFSLKKASQLVKEIGRQLATDKCVMFFLLLITAGIIAITIVKLVYPDKKESQVQDLTPPARGRRLLFTLVDLQ